MITVAKTLEEQSLSLYRSESVLILCEIVFILCARSHWNFPFDVVSKILLGVITGAKKLKSTATFGRCVLEQYCRQRDWNADTLGISCCRCLKEFAASEHSLLVVFVEINHVANEIVCSLNAVTLEFSI